MLQRPFERRGVSGLRQSVENIIHDAKSDRVLVPGVMKGATFFVILETYSSVYANCQPVIVQVSRDIHFPAVKGHPVSLTSPGVPVTR